MSVSGISSSSASGVQGYEPYRISDIYLSNSDPLPFRQLNKLKNGEQIKNNIYSNAFSSSDSDNPNNIILEAVTLTKLSPNKFKIITKDKYDINPHRFYYAGYKANYDYKRGEFELLFDGIEPFGYVLNNIKTKRKSQLWKLRRRISEHVEFTGGPDQPSRGPFEGLFSGGIIKRKSKKSKKHRNNKKTKTYKKRQSFF